MTTKGAIIFATICAVVAGVGIFSCIGKTDKELQLVPKESHVNQGSDVPGAEVGTGWSNREDPREALKDALDMALNGKEHQKPHLAIIFAASGSDTRQILLETRRLLGDKTKIYGGSSDSRGVMTDKGFIGAAEKGYGYGPLQLKTTLGIMTVTSKDIVFGAGSVNCADHAFPREAAKVAMLRAMASAGKLQSELPKIVLATAPRALEEETIQGIEDVVGKETPILGGTTGGPKFAVFGEDEVYEIGVALAAIYTDLPIGWTFEAGFDVPDRHAGIVTKVEGRTIVEIDNRPSLEVYDEWLDGHIAELAPKSMDPASIRQLLVLHPIYRKYTSPSGQNYFLFSDPWPVGDSLKSESVFTSTKIEEGERIYLSHGSWQTSLNRIGNLPRKAKLNGGISVDQRPILGIGYICAGVMGVIPESEREKMSVLINHANNYAPLISSFTWGEQGYSGNRQ